MKFQRYLSSSNYLLNLKNLKNAYKYFILPEESNVKYYLDGLGFPTSKFTSEIISLTQIEES